MLRKARRTNRNGDPYLVLELSDATGTVSAKVWENAEYFDRNISVGDQVLAFGRPSLFRDELQFEVRRLSKIDEAFDEPFIPAASRPLDELEGELDFLIDEIANADIRALSAAVWHGEDRQLLVRSPATVADHHAYLGGLVEHTIAVASICLAAAERHTHVDRDLLLAAALLHDVGRAREIEVGTSLQLSEYGQLYGHQLLGHELLLEAGRTTRALDQAWWPSLVHAVSQHHGPLDRCNTAEATILASANAMDVRVASRGPGARASWPAPAAAAQAPTR